MDMLFLILGVVLGAVVALMLICASGPSPPKRRKADLFSLAVGVALGAALFGDDDE